MRRFPTTASSRIAHPGGFANGEAGRSIKTMKTAATSILLAAMIACGCTRGPHPGRDIRISADGVMLDATPMEWASLRRALHKDMLKFGPDIAIKIVVSPEVPIGFTVTEIVRMGFWQLTFTVEGETNAIAFMRRPEDIFGPPVHEVTGIVSPAGTFATTNSPAAPSEHDDHPWGTRVIFRATPETTGRTLYDQMAEWQSRNAGLYWDNDIGSNEASEVTARPLAEPQR
jgi:hypothetical protein